MCIIKQTQVLSIVREVFLNFFFTNRQVQYAGDFCQDKNVGYFVAFGSIFATLSAVAIIQLVSKTF